MTDVYSLNQSELSLEQKISYGLYPSAVGEPLVRIAPVWFFFGISALWCKVGTKISATIRSCQDRDTSINGKWVCWENIVESVAFVAAGIAASGTALATVVKKRDDVNTSRFDDLERLCDDLGICEYHGSDMNHEFYVTKIEGTGYIHHFNVRSNGISTPVSITRDKDGHLLIVHINQDVHPKLAKRADDFEGQTLSGYIVDTKYCHPFGSSESLDPVKDWDALHSQLMCKQGVGGGNSNSIKVQLYDHNKESTIAAFQSVVRQLTDFLKLVCPTAVSDGISCAGSYTS